MWIDTAAAAAALASLTGSAAWTARRTLANRLRHRRRLRTQDAAGIARCDTPGPGGVHLALTPVKEIYVCTACGRSFDPRGTPLRALHADLAHHRNMSR
jgi:HAMP domain-containing protein